ncbi:MAG: acyl-CoA dehydrogenase family protein, partial [Acidobacteriota bacterium]|nr:acyl-CoA dehydrogenase family protein [Acidobacteriota bacterium]
MNFEHSEKARRLEKEVSAFMERFVFPNQERYYSEIGSGDRWEPVPLIEELKSEAREQGLWNLFLPEVSGLSNVEYAPLAEIMGSVFWSAEVFNCSAPDSGNMELLHMYGSEEQKEEYLAPLLEGRI